MPPDFAALRAEFVTLIDAKLAQFSEAIDAKLSTHRLEVADYARLEAGSVARDVARVGAGGDAGRSVLAAHLTIREIVALLARHFPNDTGTMETLAGALRPATVVPDERSTDGPQFRRLIAPEAPAVPVAEPFGRAAP